MKTGFYKIVGRVKSHFEIEFTVHCSGGQMKFDSNCVSFNFPRPTETIKKINVPLKSPIKWLPKMQKNILNFQLLFGFRAIFERVVFLKNGCGRYQAGAKSTNFVFIFHEI